jgi:hypothetical protein
MRTSFDAYKKYFMTVKLRIKKVIFNQYVQSPDAMVSRDKILSTFKMSTP